jgi:hypothetical protein
MVYFHTKNPNLVKFWGALEWKMFAHFMTLLKNLRPFDICNSWPFVIVCCYLVYFSCFGMFGPRNIWQPWTMLGSIGYLLNNTFDKYVLLKFYNAILKDIAFWVQITNILPFWGEKRITLNPVKPNRKLKWFMFLMQGFRMRELDHDHPVAEEGVGPGPLEWRSLVSLFWHDVAKNSRWTI